MFLSAGRCPTLFLSYCRGSKGFVNPPRQSAAADWRLGTYHDRNDPTLVLRNSPHLPKNGFILPFVKGALAVFGKEGFKSSAL